MFITSKFIFNFNLEYNLVSEEKSEVDYVKKNLKNKLKYFTLA